MASSSLVVERPSQLQEPPFKEKDQRLNRRGSRGGRGLGPRRLVWFLPPCRLRWLLEEAGRSSSPPKCLCSIGVAPPTAGRGPRTLSPAAGAPCPLGSPGLCWVVKDAASLSQSGEGTELPIPFPPGRHRPKPCPSEAGPQMAPRILAGALPAPLGPPAADAAFPEEFLLPGESKGQGTSRWPVWTLCQDCTPSVMLWHQACPWQVQVRGPFSAGPWEGPTPFLLQLQPQERWFVMGGAWICGTMAALHVHLHLPGCSH